MKITHLCTYPSGGATIACLRLHQALLGLGHDSRVVFRRIGADATKGYDAVMVPETSKQKLKGKLDRIMMELRLKPYAMPPLPEIAARNAVLAGRKAIHQYYSLVESEYRPEDHPWVQEADIVHLHWVADFVDYKRFFGQIKQPIVWTFHDENAYTGGCHYALDCAQFRSGCGVACPQLEGAVRPDYAAFAWGQKQAAYQQLAASQLHIIGITHWIADRARTSALLGKVPSSVIRNCIDPIAYQQIAQAEARKFFPSIPTGARVLVFIANEIASFVKGYSLLCAALAKLKDQHVFLLVVGSVESDTIPPPIPHKFLGFLSNATLMNMALCAADYFVTPSLADNYPNVILEAHLSGTPTIGLPIGGIPEMILEGQDGYIAAEATPAALATTIDHALEHGVSWSPAEIRQYCIHAHLPAKIAGQHLELYQKLLG